MKRTIIFVVIFFGLIALVLIAKPYFSKNTPTEEVYCTLDAKVCPDGSSVGRVPPDCEFAECPVNTEGITVTYPYTNSIVTSPLTISGMATGPWFFEANFSAELYDEAGNLLGTSILTAEGEWMTEDFVPFEGTMEFSSPDSESGTLRFMSANPSGLPENQKTFSVPVKF